MYRYIQVVSEYGYFHDSYPPLFSGSSWNPSIKKKAIDLTMIYHPIEKQKYLHRDIPEISII